MSSRATVSPPTPESKNPIGRLSIFLASWGHIPSPRSFFLYFQGKLVSLLLVLLANWLQKGTWECIPVPLFLFFLRSLFLLGLDLTESLLNFCFARLLAHLGHHDTKGILI